MKNTSKDILDDELTLHALDTLYSLASLEGKPEEQDELQQDLKQILQLMAQVKSVDTENILPLTHPVAQKLRLRADKSQTAINFDTIAPLAPQKTEKGYYLVPKIIG